MMQCGNLNNSVLNENEINAISSVLEGFLVGRLKYSERVKHFLIMHQENSDKCTAYFCGRGSNGQRNDLYFRFGDYAFRNNHGKYIVVARIGFRYPNKGHGTALLKELCDFGEKFGYEYLAIESPNDDCQIFMKKLGFKDTYDMPIHELKKSIKNYQSRKLS